MEISVSVKGLDSLISKLRGFTTSADQIIQETMLESAEQHIVVVAKALAPFKTGALRESIAALPGEEPLQILIVADKFYARFLEYGTRFIPEGKFTFLRPAIEEGYENLVSDLQEK